MKIHKIPCDSEFRAYALISRRESCVFSFNHLILIIIIIIIIIIITLFKSQIILAEHECSTNWGDCKSNQSNQINQKNQKNQIKMLVFEERGKPEYPEKNLSEQSRVRESNPGHIGGRRALSPLRQPCSPIKSPCSFRSNSTLFIPSKFLLPPQGFGPEAKTRGGIIVSPRVYV